MSSSESILDEIEFTWKIDNFSHHRQNTSEAIQSPPLCFGSPRHSVWILNLYPRGRDRYYEKTLTTQMVRMEGSLKRKAVCKVSLVAKDGNAVEGKVSTNLISFLWNHAGVETYRGKNVLDKDYLEIFLPNNIMTLRCHFTLFGDPPQSDWVAELKELSESIGHLFDSGYCSDLVLCTRGRDFSVHRAILRQRAPKLFKDLGLLGNPKLERVDMKDISASVLEMVLSYLYRGTISPTPVDDKTSEMLIDLGEMTRVAERFNIVELAEELISLSSPATIYTHITSLSRTIDLVIELIQLKDCKRISKLVNFGPMQFLFTFQVLESEKFKGFYSVYNLHPSIRCLSLGEEDVCLCCKLSICCKLNQQPSPSKVYWPNHRYNFSKDNPEHPMPAFEIVHTEVGEIRVLHLDLKVVGGKQTHSIEGQKMTYPEVSSLFGMNLLRSDLASMFEETNQTENGGDVTLVFADHTMQAHRTVLSARSPVFASMFAHDMTEKNTNRVDILDIDYAAALRLVRFMYSGNVSKDSFAEDCSLYTAADKYQVTILFRKCSGFLAAELGSNNACDLLVLAYLHNDNELMETVLDYFRIHEDIFETSDWKALSETHPPLASRVHEEVSFKIDTV